MKKILFILIPSFLLALAIYLVLQLVFFRNTEKGGLQVTATPKSRVFLNNKEIGQTPLCKCDPPDMLPVGNYDVRVVPLSGTSPEFTQRITITGSVLTVVDRKFSDAGSSESSVISLSPLTEKTQTELLVDTQPEGASIWLDNTNIGTSPYRMKQVTGDTDHTLVLKKSGYKEKTVNIHTPVGYLLSATIGLGVDVSAVAGTPQVASPAASITPLVTPTPTITASVTILSTPNGFLRVRSTASTTGAEIGRVSTGETYPMVSESDGWFEITLTDGTVGWISSAYAVKK